MKGAQGGAEYDVVITDGDFRVIEFIRPLNGFIYTYLEHKCPYAKEKYAREWCGYSTEPSVCHRECHGCGEYPPDGLQAVLWFLHEREV